MNARIFNTSDADMEIAREVAAMLDTESSVVVADEWINIVAPSAIAKKWMERFPEGHARMSESTWVGNGQYFWHCNMSVRSFEYSRQAA